MNCNIIQDLLPLYVDECCSPESGELVAGHLATCGTCRRMYEQMQNREPLQEGPDAGDGLHRVSGWKASLLQSGMLYISFAVIVLGVFLESCTPAGDTNGLWAVALIVPATGWLLSLANWFFLRLYRSRTAFSNCSCAATLALTLLGYVWAWRHYTEGIAWSSPLVWVGAALSITFVVLSKVLSQQYARYLGKEG